MRLATLIPGPNCTTDVTRQGTYAGGTIPRDRHGDLMFRLVNGDREFSNPREAYESAIIRISGSFDD